MWGREEFVVVVPGFSVKARVEKREGLRRTAKGEGERERERAEILRNGERTMYQNSTVAIAAAASRLRQR